MEIIAQISVGVMFACIAFLALVLISKPIVSKIRAKKEVKKNESNSNRKAED